jgi:hypothetical protein
LNDVILGGLISLVSSLMTTGLVATLAYRRDMRTRWDRDTLTTVSQSLVSAERTMGRCYAWAAGEHSAENGRSRPAVVDDILDLAFYQLEELAVLFPKIADLADSVQDNLIALVELTRAAREASAVANSPEYRSESERLRGQIQTDMAAMRSAAQRRLSIA